jgi:hypothetical protein
LLRRTDENRNKFPPVRRYENNDEVKGKLLGVRCAECDQIPYFLKEGNPSRARLFGAEGVSINRLFVAKYNYWSYGIGHLLELYEPLDGSEGLEHYRCDPLEIGFFVEEDVNLIFLAYRFLPDKWFMTPYQWARQEDFARAVPPLDPAAENDRHFTVAIVGDPGGKYAVVRKSVMNSKFASKFHAAIRRQIEAGEPRDMREYSARIESLYGFLMDDGIDSLLVAQTELFRQ